MLSRTTLFLQYFPALHWVRLQINPLDSWSLCDIQDLSKERGKTYMWTSSWKEVRKELDDSGLNYRISVDWKKWDNTLPKENVFTARVEVRGDNVFGINKDKVFLNDNVLQLPVPDASSDISINDVQYNNDTHNWYVARWTNLYVWIGNETIETIQLPHPSHKIFVSKTGEISCILREKGGRSYFLRQNGFYTQMGTSDSGEINSLVFDPVSSTLTGKISDSSTSQKINVSYSLNPNAHEVYEKNQAGTQKKITQEKILELLAGEWIETLEDMKAILLRAQQASWLEVMNMRLQKDLDRSEGNNQNLMQQIWKLQADKKYYVEWVETLLKKIKNIKEGITKQKILFTNNLFSISEPAQKELGIHPEENYPVGVVVKDEDKNLASVSAQDITISNNSR